MFEHTDYEFLDGEGLENLIQFDSDKENLPVAGQIAGIISQKRKRDHSEEKHCVTKPTQSNATQTMDEFGVDPLSDFMDVKRLRADSPAENQEDSTMNVDAEPEVVQRFIVCPIYSGNKRKKLFCSTPTAHRMPGNVITLAVPLQHPDISDYDSSSLTDSTRTTGTEKSLTALGQDLNGIDSGIALTLEMAAQDASTSGANLLDDVRTMVTPKIKKISRKQVLAPKFDAETTDDDEVFVKVEPPKRRGRTAKRPKPDEQESVVEINSDSGRSSRSRTREAIQTRSTAAKRPKVAHICHVCNVEVATATILRYHLRKCGKTPDKSTKK